MKEKKESKLFSVLQRVGRSFMLPIALLPIAGLLLGVGSSLTNPTTIETYNLGAILGEGTILNSIMTVFANTGNIVFANLPLIFAMGVALGMAIKAQELGATGVIVGNITLFAVLIYELVGPLLTKIALTKAGEIDPEGRTSARHEHARKKGLHKHLPKSE